MITSPGIGDQAPDFTADTTEGRISFHQWLGNSYGVLFSHPKDFTPICTTELGYLARIKGEFDKRGHIKLDSMRKRRHPFAARVIDTREL